MKQITNLSLVSPGFFGLNTQESGVTISPNFAQLTDNVVIDKYGRLGARKGWDMMTTSGDTSLGGNSIKFMLEHVNADNTTTILSGGNNKVWTGGISATLTDITPAAYTVSGDRWKGASIYDHALLVQDGQEPLVYSAAISPVCQPITTYRSASAQNFGSSYPKDVIAAWGRFWTHDSDTIYWSTDIADTAFPAFYGGTSGTLNIAAVLPNNADTIVALAAHNDFLVIFCKNNIVLYSGASNPIGTAFQLNDVIAGVGCVARDSVQLTGNDLIFLSDTGIRSLGRIIQEKSLPLRDLTKNVRDDFLNDMATEIANRGDLDDVVSVYSETNAFYLITFPYLSTVYVLDMRSPLEDGSARVTTWYNYQADSFCRRRNRDLLIGKTNGIGKYAGYEDNGIAFRMRYFSHFIDFGNSTVNKMLKQIGTTVVGGANQTFVIKCAFDYENIANSYVFTIPPQATIAEYGIAEYGDNAAVISEYTLGLVIDNVKSSVGGSGNVMQLGFEADVNGSELSVQKIDAFVKTGRVS
jgi:hypothetical protein